MIRLGVVVVVVGKGVFFLVMLVIIYGKNGILKKGNIFFDIGV